jgi:hypothetical protein
MVYLDKTNEASASSGTNFLMPRQKTRMVERTNVPAAALPLDHMLGQDSLHSTYVSGAGKQTCHISIGLESLALVIH